MVAFRKGENQDVLGKCEGGGLARDGSSARCEPNMLSGVRLVALVVGIANVGASHKSARVLASSGSMVGRVVYWRKRPKSFGSVVIKVGGSGEGEGLHWGDWTTAGRRRRGDGGLIAAY